MRFRTAPSMSCVLKFYRRHHAMMAATAFAVLPALAGRATAAFSYTAQDLGVVGTDVQSFGYGINNSGVVVGESDSNTASQGAYYKGGALIGMGTFGGTTGTAAAINSAGIAVGTASDATTSYAFTANTATALPPPALSKLPLATPAGYSTPTATGATGINTAGAVIGEYTTATTNPLAYKWNPGNSTLTPLDPVGQTGLGRSTSLGGTSFANGINTAGTIVGQATNAANDLHAFVYSGSTMYDIGTNGASTGSTSAANAINSNGLIVGSITDASTSVTSAFSFTYTGTSGSALTGSHFMALDTSATFASTDALAVNSSGEIVGDATDADSNPIGFIYIPGTGIKSIDSLFNPASGIDVQYATGINDSGQIVAYGTVSGSSTHAILLNPLVTVPEPASAGLVGGSLLLVVNRRRRHARRSVEKTAARGRGSRTAGEGESKSVNQP